MFVLACVWSFYAQSISIISSEMAEPIWTNLGSFESSRGAIDQILTDYGGDYRSRRHNRLSDLWTDPLGIRECIIKPNWIIRERHYHTARWIKKSFFAFLYRKDIELLLQRNYSYSAQVNFCAYKWADFSHLQIKQNNSSLQWFLNCTKSIVC